MKKGPDAEGVTLIEWLARAARRRPEQTALVDDALSLNYRELNRLTLGFAVEWIRTGLQPGARCVLFCERKLDMTIAFLSAARAGAVVCVLDARSDPAAHEETLALVRPTFVVHATPMKAATRAALSDCCRVTIEGDTPAERADLYRARLLDTPPEPAFEPRPDDPVYLNLTSGTSGRPKAAVTTHRNLYWNTRASVEALDLRADDVQLILFPLAVHPHEMFCRPLYLGGTAVMLDTPDPREIARTVEANGVNVTMAVGTIYRSLLRYASRRPVRAALRLAESGGMPVEPELNRAFQAHFGLPITPVWGSTETAGVAMVTPPGETAHPSAAGRPAPYYEVRVVNEDGNEAEVDEPGEVRIRGPGVVTSYFDRPEETRTAFRDGWFHTGDIAHRDADGFLYIHGRASGMIKMGGLKVFPGEIEQTLLGHPDVREAAVVPQPDALHGETPCAYIVAHTEATIDERALLSFCRERLPALKTPRRIVFCDALPRTGGGKIRYGELRDRARRERTEHTLPGC